MGDNNVIRDDAKTVRLSRISLQTLDRNIAPRDASLATDYFDSLELQKIELTGLHDALLNAGEKGRQERDISMQTYVIYCMGEQIKKCLGKKYYAERDDFYRRYYYISIIQVYITPETLARAENPSVVDECEEDLYQAVVDAIDSENVDGQEDNCEYRIYRVLSAGDFAILIGSKKPDLPHSVAVQIHNRYVDDRNTHIILYKTYSLLSIGNIVVPQDSQIDEGQKGHFIIRASYSNLFWGASEDDRNIIEKHYKCVQDEINLLYGRYDFSVALSEELFLEVFADIRHEKLGIMTNAASPRREPDNPDYKVSDYLRFLLENRYLSYINERYCVDLSGKSIKDIKANVHLKTKDGQQKYIEEKNHDTLEKIKVSVKKCVKEISELQGYQKNINYEAGLLERLVHLAAMTNMQADTRVYSIMLMDQLRIVTDGILQYTAYIKDGHADRLGELENSLRRAIANINSFSTHVRDNNLQTLQTPNYNLESNMSVEKILIGYMGFLTEVIDQYHAIAQEENSSIGKMQDLYPLVIPGSGSRNLVVEVRFQNVRPDSSGLQKKELMVVECPTFKELTNVPETAAELLHEVGHQFRYESRDKRNDVILHLMAQAFCEPVADDFSDIFLLENIDDDSSIESFKSIFCREMSLVLYDWLHNTLNALYPELLKNGSLVLLSEKVRKVLEGYINDASELEHFKSRTYGFLKRAGSNVIDMGGSGSRVRQCLISCKHEIDRVLSSNNKDDRDAAIYSLYKELNNLYNLIKGDGNEGSMYGKSYSAASGSVELLRASDTFRCNDALSFKKILGHKTFDSLYNYYKKTQNGVKENEQITPEIARYLGIDEKIDDNRSRFTDELGKVIVRQKEQCFELIELKVRQYREITADMNMYYTLKFSPFGYIYMLMRNFIIEEGIDEVYLRRISAVLYADQYFNKDHVKKELEECRDKLEEYALALIENYLSLESTKEYAIKMVGALSNVEHLSWSDLIEACRKTIESIQTSGDKEIIQMDSDLRHLVGMTMYIDELTCRNEYYGDAYNAYPELKEDLMRGAKTLCDISEGYDNTAFGNYRHGIQRYFNDPWYKYEKSEHRDFNQHVIDMIQYYYYDTKIQTLQKQLDT